MKRDLTEFNLSLYIDKSGSMDDPIKKGSSTTRWEAVREAIRPIIKSICKIDQDGITLAFFNSKIRNFTDNVTEEVALQMFQSTTPSNGTSIVEVVKKALDTYNSRVGTTDKKELVIIITDGEDGEGKDGLKKIAQMIIDQTQKMESDSDLTFLFVQVGDDPNATKGLKSLDDDLQSAGAKFDIVDVKTMDELGGFDTFEEALIHAIED